MTALRIRFPPPLPRAPLVVGCVHRWFAQHKFLAHKSRLELFQLAGMDAEIDIWSQNCSVEDACHASCKSHRKQGVHKRKAL